MKHILAGFLSLISFALFSQARFGFEPSTAYKIIKGGDTLSLAWSGGLNEPQFSTIDLNGDGNEDLVTFDRTGNRLLTFLQVSVNGTPEYRYAPEYRDSFPPDIEYWMLLVDYNCDGKKDIFCDAVGGIGVYENTSKNGGLSFEWALPLHNIRSDYGQGKTNLHIIDTDLPGLADVDADGDLDIFVFSLGNTLQWHENIAPCGLDFYLNTWCWGRFEEGALDNTLTLNGCQGLPKTNPGASVSEDVNKTQHSGSTTLMINLNGDTLQDVLLGDVSFSNGVAAINGGRRDSAFMVSQDTLFPSYDVPADVFLFPAFFYEDIDFDGKKDLIAAPNIQGGKTLNGIWWYKNTNTNDSPVFDFQDTSLFQKDMVDLGEGAIPVLIDIDFDGKLDLFVSNYGQLKTDLTYKSYIQFYKNTGTSFNPQFTLVEEDFENISSLNIGLNLVPAFADLDGDVDLDMVVGAMDGKLYYFENIGGITTPDFTFKTANWQGIDVGNASAPHFFDIDGDNDLDLFIGEEEGTINFYSNDGNNPPTFTLETEKLGGVDVKSRLFNVGYSLPVFYEQNDTVSLFVGSQEGGIVQYDSINRVMSLPASMTNVVGTGTTASSGNDLTPFGATKRNGRNQLLYKASELKALGFVYGKITDIAFNITNQPSTYLSQGFYIKMKNVNMNSISQWETDMTEVYNQIYPFSKGWNNITLHHQFLWDGESDLLVEICFSKNSPAYNIDVEMTDVGFAANGYGDVSTWNQVTQDGCDMPYLSASTKRPNITLKLIPTFKEIDVVVKDGNRNLAAVGNLNGDNYIDLILGNYAGGLTFYKGVKYVPTIGIKEYHTFVQTALAVYPNPTNGLINVEMPEDLDVRNTTLKLFDITGRLVLSEKADQVKTEELNLFGLSEGIYVLMVSDNQRTYHARIIHQTR